MSTSKGGIKGSKRIKQLQAQENADVQVLWAVVERVMSTNRREQ